MANYDAPVGFVCVTEDDKHLYKASAACKRGDMIAIVTGEILPFAIAVHDEAIGVACQDIAALASGYVYDNPEAIFSGQTSGVFAATMIGANCDVQGTTGIMEVDENANTKGLITIVGVVQDNGHPDATGANTKVLFKINKHYMGALATDTAGTHTGPVVGDVTGSLSGTTVSATGLINSSAGAVQAATTVTAGTGITSTTGNITATAGKVVAGTFLELPPVTGDTVAMRIGWLAAKPANGTGWGKGSLCYVVADDKTWSNAGTAANVSWVDLTI